MTTPHCRPTFRPLLLVAAVAAALATTHPAPAYERYNDGCQGCHGSFLSGGYLSLATGVAWPASLHTVHRSSSYMSSECDLCHRNDDNDDPFIATSDGTGVNPGYGCNGCHGGPAAGGPPTGSSLRRHHVYAGATECATVACHPAPGPVAQESAPPPYYGTVDTLAAAACNDDTATSEDWNGDGQGLDNDGDLLYDGDDPACQDGFVFHDGFVSGDAGEWGGGTVSSH